jgi:anaerobic selenocysteine-containing dehydrogenase
MVHLASVTHGRTGERLNGIRLVQVHPRTAACYGVADGVMVRMDSPHGSVTGTA